MPGPVPTSRTAPQKSQLKTASSGRTAGILSHGGLHGGDVNLDFVAAGPDSYNHITGVGGEYGAREIGPDGVVESLEGGDFECGDLVVFFTEVEIEDGAEGSGSIELDYSFGAETTGQPGIGFTDIVSVGINTGDSAIDSNGNETATLVPGSEQTVGDELLGSVVVTGLSAGETTIVRIVVELGCEVGTPTGNLLNAIIDADVVGGDNISVGNETVPMKQVGDVARPGMNVDKTCPEFSQVGNIITYSISIQNTGNETLNLTSVVDTVNGHSPVNITASFPATIAAGATVTRTYSYTVVAADPDPLPNSVAVSALGASSGATITGSDSCSTDILNPDIDVEKTCTDFAQVGDTITYTITVTNTGDEDLEGITVDDSLLGDLSDDFADTLAAGDSESHEFTYEVTEDSPDPVPNEVTASGSGVDSGELVDDSANCSTDILNPDIDVEKTCTDFAQVGDTITYTITVTNTGDEDLEGITVDDSLLGDLSDDFADTLAAGDSESHEFTYEVTEDSPDPVPNEVTASGSGVDSGELVDDSANCSTDILNPDIDVEKTCTDFAQVGDTITYTITVTNTGDEDLEGITVDDSLLGDLSDDFADTLAAGDSESHEFTYEVTEDSPDPVPNEVTASGSGVDSGELVDDSANCSTDILNPDIDVEKTCTDFAQVGDTITYTITVTNTGDEDLEGITVDDSLLGDLSDDFADTLAAGDSESHEFTYEVTEDSPDPVPNEVTASGSGVDSGELVDDSANCSTDILNPDIDVEKTCTDFAQVGDTITYTITVTNTGDEDLEGITVDDSLLGDLSDDFADTLAAGDSESHEFTYEVTEDSPDPVPNEVTASGSGVDSGELVDDSANCSTDILNPDIDVEKTCTDFAQVGDTITYTITVTNTGDEDLEGITVDDSLLGDLSDDFADTLAAGDSESHEFTYEVTEDSPDPVPNEVTASGSGVDSGELVDDSANCSTDLLFPLIELVKDGPALVHRGDTITYSFTVTNTGEVELFDVALSDPICDPGTIVPGAEVDASLAVGEVWTFSCTHLVTETDDDPLPNTATVIGDTEEGEGGNPVTDSDDHLVDIISPAIDIVKTVDEEVVPVGTTVTFTYVVTNTGDTTLYEISVDDDILGHIGDIPVLEPGDSVTLTHDFVVGDEIVTNIGTAEGEDILGRSVSADDDATVSPILGTNPPNPPNNPPTPFTGSDAGRLGLITIVLFGIGVTVVASTRRRRPEREAA